MPEFDRSIMIDFQGAKMASETSFLVLREIDERFSILGPIESELEDTRSWVHSNHTQLQMSSSEGADLWGNTKAFGKGLS